MSEELDQKVLGIHSKVVSSMLKVEKLLAEEVNSTGLNDQENLLFVSRVINLVFQRHYGMCLKSANEYIKEQENENKN